MAHASEASKSSSSDKVELPDTYTHATSTSSKEVLEGEAFEQAMQFLADSSHYFYINRATPYYGNYTQFPETGFDTEWRSPLNGRVYRGPYYDPISRSVVWSTTNPNGGINVSVGSYWGAVPPNTELALNNHELEGYEPSDDWQIVCYMGSYQSVSNFIREGRGSLLVDGALVSNYGLTNGWNDRNVLDVEVKLRSYKQRQITPQEYYDGLAPTTISWAAAGAWASADGWGKDAGENQYRSIPQFWGCATGDDAELNLNSDEERDAYIARAEADSALMEALGGLMTYLYFDVLQIINIQQEIGFDFEQGSGKINGLDMDNDGMLDRYPEGSDQAGELILQNAYGVENARLLPEWAYDLSFDQDWWVTTDETGTMVLINSEGKKLVGANEDGTYVLEDK